MDDECPSSGMRSDQFPFLYDLINSFVSFVGGRSNLFVDFSQLAEFLKTPYCWAMPALSCAAICPFLVTVLATEGANILKLARAVPQKGSFTAQHTILRTPSSTQLSRLINRKFYLTHKNRRETLLSSKKMQLESGRLLHKRTMTIDKRGHRGNAKNSIVFSSLYEFLWVAQGEVNFFYIL